MTLFAHALEKPIAILGGGAVGKGIAADCVLAGRTDVRLYDVPEYADNSLAGVAEHGITLVGDQLNEFHDRRAGTAALSFVSRSIEETLDGAGIVLVAVPGLAHDTFLRALVPHLRDGMIVHIIPDNYGTLRLRRMMREAGCDKQVVIGGWNSAPHGVRLVSQSKEQGALLRVVNRFTRLRGCALPMRDQEIFLRSIQAVPAFDCAYSHGGIEAGDTVLDVNFSNLNPVLHIPTTVLGVGVMENYGLVFGTKKEDYSLFSHAMCPSIATVQKAFFEEETAIAHALGVGILTFADRDFYFRESVLGRRYMDAKYGVPFDDPCANQIGVGPSSIHHRFITEDVPMSLSVYRHLALKAGVQTPVMDALMLLAGVMTGRNFFSEGMSLEPLGIADMDVHALRAFLL